MDDPSTLRGTKCPLMGFGVIRGEVVEQSKLRLIITHCPLLWLAMPSSPDPPLLCNTSFVPFPTEVHSFICICQAQALFSKTSDHTGWTHIFSMVSFLMLIIGWSGWWSVIRQDAHWQGSVTGADLSETSILIRMMRVMVRMMMRMMMMMMMMMLMMMMVMTDYQQIPTSHIPNRWEYVMMMKGGNTTSII